MTTTGSHGVTEQDLEMTTEFLLQSFSFKIFVNV